MIDFVAFQHIHFFLKHTLCIFPSFNNFHRHLRYFGSFFGVGALVYYAKFALAEEFAPIYLKVLTNAPSSSWHEASSMNTLVQR